MGALADFKYGEFNSVEDIKLKIDLFFEIKHGPRLFIPHTRSLTPGCFICQHRPFWEDRGVRRAVFSQRGGSFPAGSNRSARHCWLQRDRVLNTLQELDFDYAMGKIPEEDYPVQRLSLVKNGADILRRLDVLQANSSQAVQIEDHEARLEAAVAARREGIPVVAGSGAHNGRKGRAGVPDDALERQIAARRREHQEKAAGFCPQCGSPVQKSDLFCPKCGTQI